MTAEKKNAFLTYFADSYDLPGSASRAGIRRKDVYALLSSDAGARKILDRAVCARIAGAALTRIREEYEKIAFGPEEEIKPADRIRALEQLRIIASAESKNGAAPTLEIRCEYV